MARVRFQLPVTADVAESALQISGVVVPPGRVQALALSKQLLVVDTVSNLLEIRDILRAEQAAYDSQDNIREFTLQHRRAETLLEEVLTMLGLDPATITYPQEMRQELQRLKLFITANDQRNSLVVNAPAERMKIVEDIIKQLDVPEMQTTDDALVMLPYKVEQQDPTSVINTLQEVGGLSPQTRLQADPISRTIYAYADEKDHEIIREFLDKTAPESILRLADDELEQHPMRELARVRFELPVAADVHQAATQIRGILSTEGNVQMLASSRQLIVDDTVANLIDIRDVLKAEAKALESAEDIREFAIVHRRAEEMVEQVLTMLGLDPATARNPQELRRELQELKVFITTNHQRNSLVVNAPADKMAKVEQILKQLDVPLEGAPASAAGDLSMVPYKVSIQNPESVRKALIEIGNLDPRTRLQSDLYSKTLYAFATKSDHEKIQRFIEKTDPNLVRRVDAEQLEEYPATEVLRVRFQLPKTVNMEQANEQVKGILGLGGKVQSLEASKQLIVVDTASNLIEVREILKAEELALESQNNIREFRLQYRRADDMYNQVLTMLGLDPEGMRNPQEMRRELQTLKLFITVNNQRNSLLVNAPADKMFTVEQLIKQLDIEENQAASGNDNLAATDASRPSMVSYKLEVQNVEAAIKALEEIGNLEPRTRLQGDPLNNTIYAFASKRDHEKIRQFVDDMDPNQVRRVHPDELEDYPPHDVVRAIFQLPLSSDILTAEDQIKGILGIEARVQSLESSKQLVVVDKVSNLIDVRDVLYAEEMAAEAYKMPRIFPLKYRRATYVVDQVMILLGLDPSARKTTTELQFEAQRMQMMMQSAQQRGRDISKIGAQDIHIAVNRRENSLIVNGPIEKMPFIERAIEQIDVPSADGEIRTADPGPVTMEKYQMVTAGAEGVIRALEEIGNLHPKTQMQPDSTGKVLFAFATAADHITIKKMIDKLDGTGRRPEVRWLPPRLPADQVAGSIMALIVGPEKKKDNNRRPYYYYWSFEDEDEEELNEGFRVLPDIDNNRLLLWANDNELEEVDRLIEKLSDNSDSAYADRRKVRRIEARDPEATLKLLEKLQSTWSGKNRLEIDAPPAKAKPSVEPPIQPDTQEEKKTNGDKQTLVDPRFDRRNWFLAQVIEEPDTTNSTPAQQVAEGNQATEPPPIKITINEKGEIIISSEDTEALDRLESLIEQLAPVQTEFHSFELHYIHVMDVVYNLETYFEDELSEDEGDSFRDWYGRWRDTKPKEAPASLGKRPPLRFIDDIATNTLIVANASASQLKIIKDIIDLYDRPANPDLYLHRKTEAIRIEYSQASDIASTLKDVYRDLLSSKDKEFQDKEGKQSFSSIGADKPYVFGDARSVRNGREGPVLVRFSGALSIGVDSVSNSVIVSAREEVLDEVKQTISQLDKAAKDDSVVRVHLADGILDAEDLQGIINGALADPWIGGKPNAKSSSSRSRSRTNRSRSSRSRSNSRSSRSRSR